MENEVSRYSRYNAVDRDRLVKALEGKGSTLRLMSMEMGYAGSYLTVMITRNKGISRPALLYMEQKLGITYDMIRPEEKNPEPQPVQMQMQAAPQAADLSRLEEMLQEALHKLEKANEFNEQIRGGFRVRTSTQLMSQDIEAGVRDALKSHWNQIRGDYFKNLREAVQAAAFNAIKQAFDMVQDSRRAG